MLRYLLGLFLAAVIGAAGFLVYRALAPTPLPVNLPPPASMRATASTAFSPGGWTNSHRIELIVGNRGSAGADVEVKPAGSSFTGNPTTHVGFSSEVAQVCRTEAGLPCSVSNLKVTLIVRLPDGKYHWQARLHGNDGVSPWRISQGILGVDTQAPTITALESPNNPNPTKTYHDSALRFVWQGSDRGSGIEGYSYRLDSDPNGLPGIQVRTSNTGITLNGINTGRWYFHLRAVDQAGNWGPTKTFPIRIDVTPPGLTGVSFDRFDFNPQFVPLRVSFAVTRPAREVRVGVYSQNSGRLVRLYSLTDLKKGQPVSLAWDGKDTHGVYVPTGSYEIYVRALDSFGHSSVRGWSDFLVTNKRIVVSLSQQKLVAYNGNSVFLTSLVTTGNKALPTPTGTYSIMDKFHPFTFRSPWPKSSPYWYPPSKTEWAMLFREGGYFIHDAPWRAVFGPGSNSQIGTPGNNYTGTHGCVNVPANVAQQLYAWAPIGATVQVVP